MTDDRLWHYFTLEEANAALETVRPILLAMQEDHALLMTVQDEYHAYETRLKRYGLVLESHRVEAEILDVVDRIKLGIEAISLLGIELKDIEQGLIDFPAIRRGEIVYLCYRLDEPEIIAWHTLDSGFGGRRAIDDPFDTTQPG